MIALETSYGVFQRAIVLKIVKYNKFNEPIRAKVRFVDNGRYDEARVSIFQFQLLRMVLIGFL